MAISVKHNFVSAKANGLDSTQIQPSNWNDTHAMTMAAGKVLGRDTSAAGAMQELPIAVDPVGNVSLSLSDNGAGLGPNLKLRRISTSPASNDLLGSLQMTGFNSAAAEILYVFLYGYIISEVSGAEVGGISIQTSLSGVLLDSLVVTQARTTALGGLVSRSPASGVGYVAGAGGTVAQLGSKTTGVTLNKVTGQITMANAALAAGAIASFTCSSTAVELNDIPTVAVQSPRKKYLAFVSGVFAGGFDISVQNISGGALSEAVILNYGLFKGTTI